jgi:hypothetical protein
VLDAKFYHKKLEFIYIYIFEAMVIMAHYFSLTHMNFKKLKLKII